MFLDSNHTVFTFRSLCDLLDGLLAFLISILKILQKFKTTDTGLHISQASDNVWKVL